MESILKENFIIALKLTVICFAAVVLLTAVNLLTKDRIKQNEIKAEKKANQEIFPAGKDFEKQSFKDPAVNKDKIYFFKVLDQNDQIIGYNVSSIGGGYGGDMKVMVAFDQELKILNMKLLKNNETPGLGKNAEKEKYMLKFKNSNTTDYPFPAKKSQLPSQFQDSVTGATITYNGISKAAQLAISLLEKELKD